MIKQKLVAASGHRLFWPLVALVAMLVGNLFFTPGFLDIEMKQGHLYGSVIDILSNAAPLMLVGLGMTVVIATKGIDLSVGAVVAISGALAAQQMSHLKDPNSVSGLFTAMALALVLSLVLGLWNGLLVAGLGIQPIIATLILMVAGRGIAQLITGGYTLEVRSDPFKVIGSGYWLTLPVPMLIALAVVGVAALVIRRTALGVLIEAIGGNTEASRLAGVRWRGLIWLAYAFCGLTAGMAGLMISSYTSAADGNNAGLFIELDAILAVVLGGTLLTGGRFSIGGTVVGALVIQTLITTINTSGIPPETNMLFKSLVVTAVCLLQSPAFRAKVFRRGRGAAPGQIPAPVSAGASTTPVSESSTEVSA
ncbi:MAG TPA: ABC transporter permease [Kineosporiaceae bacterium]|nr:ABC transporter permease [Kineosporiaceae bacterium]